MAVVVVTDNNLRRQDMEGAISGTTNIGAGPGPVVDTDFFVQGAQSWGRKPNAANALRGWWTTITSTNFTTANQEVVMFKVQISNSGAIDLLGLRVRVGGPAIAAYREYFIADDGTQGNIDYPVLGGWIIAPVDPSVSAWVDAVTGSPAFTAVTELGVEGAVNAIPLGPAVFADAFDIGPGLYLVGGDSTDPDGAWSFFVADDEGAATAGRFGHVRTVEGIAYILGTMVVGRNASGTVTATVFTDQNQTIVFPGGRVAAGWNGIEVDIGDAATIVTWTSIAYLSRGRDDLERHFDTELDVDAANDELDIEAHGFETGDAVLYNDDGGTALSDLTDATEYFVRAVTVDAISLHTTRQDAFADTAQRNLTAATAGNGENQRLTRQPDTRPDLTLTDDGTPGTFDALSCSFSRFRNIVGVGTAEFNACTFLACGFIDQGTADFLGCIFDSPLLTEGEAFFLLDLDTGLADCQFTAGENGHAFEADTAATHDLDGNTFIGYGVDRAQFDTELDVNGSTEVITTDAAHGFATGDPVYYNDEGGTETIGLTDGAKYYVRNLTATTLSLHLSRQAAINNANLIDLTASTSGNGETHSLYDARAAFLNSSGGLVTLNITNGTSPTVRNTPGSTTTVNNNVAVTLTGMKDNTEVRVYAAGTATELAGIENATAGSADDRSFTFSLGDGTNIDIRVFSIGWLPADILDFTVPSSATSIPIQQVIDRQYNNP